MSTVFNEKDIAYVRSIVKEAGDMAYAKQMHTLKIHRKKDTSIVTDIDLKVQNMLINKINKKFHDSNYIFEENFDYSYSGMRDDVLSFIIDPIDGTAMYSMHLPIWCVSVGVFKGYRPLYGFVYSPASRMFFHNDDECAYLNNAPIQASRSVKIEPETNIFYASEIHNRYRFNYPGKVRNLGSTAFQACLLADNARNRSIAFVGKSFLWDWAGAIPVIVKAGAAVRYISGKEIDYHEIVSNGYRMSDFTVAYTCTEFDAIKDFFLEEDTC